MQRISLTAAMEGGRLRLSSARRHVLRREVIGVLLWVATVGVVYGTLALPFHEHLLAVFLWLAFSGLTFVKLSRSNLADTEAVFNESLDQVSQAQKEMVAQMATYSEARDALTGEHLQRVREIATQITLALGKTREEAEAIGRAAIAHDLGKIGIPDAVLGKPGKLSSEEFEVMKEHATIGERVLGSSPLFSLERQCARHHHEWWDGSGYPDGLAGERIPLVARITAVADVFDALLSERPYKDAWPVDRALAHLREESGTHFDPDVVSAFFRVCDSGQMPSYARGGPAQERAAV